MNKQIVSFVPAFALPTQSVTIVTSFTTLCPMPLTPTLRSLNITAQSASASPTAEQNKSASASPQKPTKDSATLPNQSASASPLKPSDESAPDATDPSVIASPQQPTNHSATQPISAALLSSPVQLPEVAPHLSELPKPPNHWRSFYGPRSLGPHNACQSPSPMPTVSNAFDDRSDKAQDSWQVRQKAKHQSELKLTIERVPADDDWSPASPSLDSSSNSTPVPLCSPGSSTIATPCPKSPEIITLESDDEDEQPLVIDEPPPSAQFSDIESDEDSNWSTKASLASPKPSGLFWPEVPEKYSHLPPRYKAGNPFPTKDDIMSIIERQAPRTKKRLAAKRAAWTLSDSEKSVAKMRKIYGASHVCIEDVMACPPRDRYELMEDCFATYFRCQFCFDTGDDPPFTHWDIFESHHMREHPELPIVFDIQKESIRPLFLNTPSK